MARVLGFLLGELRGKLGGTVFSRNKSGAIVRAKVTPVNPQTVRQQTARFSFGNNSILYQGLTAAFKDCWEVFARTHFNPLKGNNTGIYSGGNAFVGLRSSVNQGNTYKTTPTGSQSLLALDFVSENYVLATDPPNAPTSSTIKDSANIAYPIVIGIQSVDSNGAVNFNLSLQGISPFGNTTVDSFTNAENQQFGIGFYMSNNLKFIGAKPNTALKLNFADTGQITDIFGVISTNPPLANVPINIVLSPNINKATIRDFPCSGDVILCTPFVRNAKGAQKLMAPQYVTVT